MTVALLRWLFRPELGSTAIVIRATGPARVDGRLLGRTLTCLAVVIGGFAAGLDLAWTALAGAVIAVAISGGRHASCSRRWTGRSSSSVEPCS